MSEFAKRKETIAMSKKTYANVQSFDYYQGYFDCLKNIRSQADQYSSKIIFEATADARTLEIRMYKNLKNIHGTNFNVDQFGRYYINE